MQYTAVAIEFLAESHKLSLDNTADQFVPGAPLVTIRDLLAVAPDDPKAAADYELLARVAAAAAGKSFADVEDAGAFGTVWMNGTGIDDNTLSPQSRMAKGSVVNASVQKPITADWSRLTGSASAYTTTRDELHWLDRFFGDDLVSHDARLVMTVGPAGYGWFRGRPLDSDAHWMSGNAPGFASYVLRERDLTVIVLANVADAPAGMIGNGLAAQARGEK
jgi:CubicO group peptidase (beta-lactamase class C family)